MLDFKKNIRKIYNEFIYSGHIQSLGAVSIIAFSGILLEINVTWDVIVIVYLLFYIPYLYNRLKEIEIDNLTNPQRTKYLRTYIHRIPLIISLTSLILIASLVYLSNLGAIIFGILLLTFGIFYTSIFKNITTRIFVFKDIYVAIFFASLPLFLMVYYAVTIVNKSIPILSLLSLFIFIKAFLMQIFFDIKDTQSDKEEKLMTLPVIIGEEKTLKLLKIFSLIVTIVMPVIFSIYFNIFPKMILMLILTIPFNYYCYYLAKRKDYFSYVLQGGEFILWLMLILIGKSFL